MSANVDKIIQFIAKHANVTVVELLTSRNKPAVRARQVAMWAIRNSCRDYAGKPFSYPWIGKQFDRKHSTVFTSCQFVENGGDIYTQTLRRRIEANPEFPFYYDKGRK